MVDARVRSVGAYFMRLLGGLAVILGILGLVSSLSRGNLIGVAFSVAFIAGGAVLLKRSGGVGRAGKSASTPRGTRQGLR